MSKKSYLKLAGDKAQVAQAFMLPFKGKKFKSLFEPFAGGCSFALNAHEHFEQLMLCDKNNDLINLHEFVRDQPVSLIEKAKEIFVEENNLRESYMRIREDFNENQRLDIDRAARFLYLNKHGLNFEFVKNEEQKVPVQEILSASLVFQEKAAFFKKDFRQFCCFADEGDMLYCDPPYSPAFETESFSSYAAGGFSENDHFDLVYACEEACSRGAHVMISNHDTPFTRELYKNASGIAELTVAGDIGASSEVRQVRKEILAIYIPEKNYENERWNNEGATRSLVWVGDEPFKIKEGM